MEKQSAALHMKNLGMATDIIMQVTELSAEEAAADGNRSRESTPLRKKTVNCESVKIFTLVNRQVIFYSIIRVREQGERRQKARRRDRTHAGHIFNRAVIH